MDAASLIDIYEESFEEATQRGIDGETARKEAITAAAMMLAASKGIENQEAYDSVETIIAENQ